MHVHDRVKRNRNMTRAGYPGALPLIEFENRYFDSTPEETQASTGETSSSLEGEINAELNARGNALVSS